MNQAHMADILLPISPEPALSAWIVLVVLIAVLILLILLWQYLKQPLVLLKRQLKQGKLSPREAAHRLAHITNADIKLQQQVDQLRFQRQAPEYDELLILIDKVKYGR